VCQKEETKEVKMKRKKYPAQQTAGNPRKAESPLEEAMMLVDPAVSSTRRG
jgi:hypothetical protein